MQLSVPSKKNKRRDCGDFENESRSISNNHRRGGILSLSVAEPVPETDSVYFRRHHMGCLQKLMDDEDFNIADSLCMLCKNKEDQMRVRDAGILPNVKELS